MSGQGGDSKKLQFHPMRNEKSLQNKAQSVHLLECLFKLVIPQNSVKQGSSELLIGPSCLSILPQRAKL